MNELREPPVPLSLTDIQTITLRDELRTQGLSQRQIEDILLLLSFKPERTQLVFYYRSIGLTYREVAEELRIPFQSAHYALQQGCSDISSYLSNNI